MTVERLPNRLVGEAERAGKQPRPPPGLRARRGRVAGRPMRAAADSNAAGLSGPASKRATRALPSLPHASARPSGARSTTRRCMRPPRTAAARPLDEQHEQGRELSSSMWLHARSRQSRTRIVEARPFEFSCYRVGRGDSGGASGSPASRALWSSIVGHLSRESEPRCHPSEAGASAAHAAEAFAAEPSTTRHAPSPAAANATRSVRAAGCTRSGKVAASRPPTRVGGGPLDRSARAATRDLGVRDLGWFA